MRIVRRANPFLSNPSGVLKSLYLHLQVLNLTSYMCLYLSLVPFWLVRKYCSNSFDNPSFIYAISLQILFTVVMAIDRKRLLGLDTMGQLALRIIPTPRKTLLNLIKTSEHMLRRESKILSRFYTSSHNVNALAFLEPNNNDIRLWSNNRRI